MNFCLTWHHFLGYQHIYPCVMVTYTNISLPVQLLSYIPTFPNILLLPSSKKETRKKIILGGTNLSFQILFLIFIYFYLIIRVTGLLVGATERQPECTQWMVSSQDGLHPVTCRAHALRAPWLMTLEGADKVGLAWSVSWGSSNSKSCFSSRNGGLQIMGVSLPCMAVLRTK